MKLRVALLVAVVGMSLAVAVAKQPNPGTLGPPENFLVTQNATSVFFSWDPVDGATKYAVPVCGTVIYGDGANRYELRIHLDFNTADGVGTTYMRSGKVVLEIPKRALVRLILAKIQESGFDPRDVIGFQLEATAKVKAMNPGKGAGPQNNPWSDPADFTLRWVAPSPT